MSLSSVLFHRQNTSEPTNIFEPSDAIPGTLASKPRRLHSRTSDLCNASEETGCHLGSLVEEQQHFQKLFGGAFGYFDQWYWQRGR